ncbi:lamina-associated polypeptide 2, isoforms beta/gamma-like isoform X2 [Amphibalanus amphitrite]|uniref:lamina-associated polypeptide 2, isoforms beta/gamma-like isoform X2 n=1 Tax=Amphibalanus amphitrite TaxID=1232801 RepID=UPI001C91F32C|nr:lamina-associated polypeptide 2, isoforms beta/gamma-like isoform X2 [Amphibalanus amphitrite]XP_043223925.1 lamina-associated polypeptide 2, isoforms beta/gamma-like isoform X2 [Amphibalanus amphitrite]
MDLSGLSNDELAHQLRSHGVSPGPIVGSTRRLYERKLASLMADGRPDGPAVSPQSPAAASDGGAARRRLGGGSDDRDLSGLDPNSPALRPVFLRDETDQPSPRRAVSDLRGSPTRVRDLSTAQLNNSRSGVDSVADYEEELRPWVRQFIKLLILLTLVAAGYYVYQNGADWPAVKYLQETARAGPAPTRPPLVAPPPAAGVKD